MLFSVIHTLLIIASALVLCCLLIGVYIAKKYPGRACDMAYICLRVSYIALLILSLINFILCFV